ncbi:hypothetical protein SAMN05444004_103221 [Jannaschia faecimaris]|uniref:Uncharacterized protein n=1 Tax=Jannaschia faecimaris TaxID=1244108 RepID=A0A1H3MZ14_9RHOB|nr:hypothetical protein [Jannaschia faecimaris]SDY81941.1 hypothetical protein SAMN05444004_103221 [Jannaschia faecimaris]
MFRIIMTATAVSAVAATGAFAKGHDQGRNEGQPEISTGQTVGAAQTLGGSQGNRPADRGPTKSQGSANAGN